MAQVSDRRNQPADALRWLDKADPKHEKLAVQSQRARLLASQGKLTEARNSLRKLPETEARDAVLKIQTEAQLLRELKQWREAWSVLEQGSQRFPEDPDLLYDQAMVAEKLKRFEDMEQLLRKVIAVSPDNAGAYNALGYSFAERNINLPEARKLIEQALALRPGDAYIVDSLAWVAFREGKLDEARQLLTQAYASRQDAEIAAHLGEVLWLQGDREGAQKLWREAQARDKANETLKETLQRFGVQP
jgi:Flp pilus assembly protein TadD